MLRTTRLLTLTLTLTRTPIHLSDLMHFDLNHIPLPTRETEIIPTHLLDRLR